MCDRKLQQPPKHQCNIWRRSVNERALRRWYAKFESGDESLTNEDRGRLETVVDNKDLPSDHLTKNPGNTVRDYAEELGINP
ncbi:hypothetical protein TNCT_519081 [Trichonephila clavata]|uniref:Transposase n=1 Tax=Trichonephila clavata TaxID=2740835 RepID=A0A8X6LZ35_TRICU|nr:hypothetical protein TNCT_519081 [Trichonephila clavata]